MRHTINELEPLSKVVRLEILDMINKTHASHIAPSFSIVELLLILYGKVMNISPQNTDNPERDYFVLSKGHAASALYSVLHQFDFLTDDEIKNYYSNGSYLSGHVSHKGVKGVEISTGSLGHGACIACGIALANKIDGLNNQIYTIVGDGECNEGCIWEMATFASQHCLNNFTVIVDCNKMQAMGKTCDIMQMDNLIERWTDFGFDVVSIDGHNMHEIESALVTKSNKPKCIIANTIKGKGVSYMENELLWHYRDPQGELYSQAKDELQRSNDEK